MGKRLYLVVYQHDVCGVGGDVAALRPPAALPPPRPARPGRGGVFLSNL